jgi:hypothetical protein
MIEADHRHLFEAAQLGRLKPPVAENNLVVPIDPDGNHEAKLFNAPRDRADLLPGMLSWIVRIRNDGSDGQVDDRRPVRGRRSLRAKGGGRRLVVLRMRASAAPPKVRRQSP